MSRIFRTLLRFCSGSLLVLASACAFHGPEIHTLGLLEDYGQLSPGPDGQLSVATQELAKSLDEDLRREFAREFELIDRLDVGALQLRIALASEADSHLVLEVEVLDPESGKRLVAAVDRRKLETVGSASRTEAWAVLIRNRLASFRQFAATP